MSQVNRSSSIPSPDHMDLYFAYGSNMHLQQMAKRCPDSTIFGIGRLRSYKWQVNSRGGGNVVEGDAGDTVEGIVFKVSSNDIEKLRFCEGVEKQHFVEKRLAIDTQCILNPELRDRRTVDVVEILAQNSGSGESTISDEVGQKRLITMNEETDQMERRLSLPNPIKTGELEVTSSEISHEALVYITYMYRSPGIIREEYRARMQLAMADANLLGVSEKYQKHLCRLICCNGTNA